MKNPLFAVCILFTLIGFSCDTAEPPIIEDTPGRRDYTWSIDTLKAPQGNQFYIWNLWGSSPQDLWAVGNGDVPYTIWHYNGEKWSVHSEHTISGLISIYGFAANNSWASGGDCVFRYDGNSWQEYECFDLPNNPTNSSDIGFNSIWGETQNNMYVVGGGYSSPEKPPNIGIIYNFNGVSWNKISMSSLHVSFTAIRSDKSNKKNYYLSGIRLDNEVPDTNKLFEFDQINISEIWSGTEVATVNEFNDRIYFSIGKKIYQYRNNNFEIWKDFSGTTYLGRVWGRTEKDFFGIASDGLTHYNGSDLKIIYPTNLFINDLFVLEKDIFMLCENRIIIHGKLN